MIVAASVLSVVSSFAPVTNSGRAQTQLSLWGEPTKKDGEQEMSKALPFAPRPKLLDGSLPGDAGFE